MFVFSVIMYCLAVLTLFCYENLQFNFWFKNWGDQQPLFWAVIQYTSRPSKSPSFWESLAHISVTRCVFIPPRKNLTKFSALAYHFWVSPAASTVSCRKLPKKKQLLTLTSTIKSDQVLKSDHVNDPSTVISTRLLQVFWLKFSVFLSPFRVS